MKWHHAYAGILLATSAFAQLRTGNVQVRITFSDGHPCNLRARIQLMGSASNSPVAENYTNDSGMAEFNNVEVGNYHLIVSAQGIEETDSGLFEVDSRRGSQYVYVSVKRDDNTLNSTGTPGAPTVPTADLKIPKKAAKEFDKSTRFMAAHDWKRAIIQLKRAIAIYPGYVQAYTNLAVAYGQLGDRASERTLLQKALSLNDRFAPAYVNLARMSIVDQDFPTAEPLLEKAISLDPSDLITMILLANVELLNHHYEQAIANCRKVHSMASQTHALVHYIAARAYEHQRLLSNASAEFKTFLNEEPNGDRADAVRRELATLQDTGR